jgi:glycosyltransferase involved in cell wall biosynthesis
MHDEQIEISVVIPVYNRASVIHEAIDSALAQDADGIEVLVVDDGSTDDTAEVVSRRYHDDSRVRVIRRVNGGPAAARNTGIAQARGGYLALLDSDDIWLPEYLGSQLAVLRSSGADLVIANAEWQKDDTGQLLFDHSWFMFPDSLAAMCAGAWTLPSCTMLRMEVARRLGFEEAFRMCDDTDFMFRFNEAGYRSVPNPQVLVHYRAYRGGAAQLSADPDRLSLAAYAVMRHHSQAHPEVFRRGPDFDRQIGELLLKTGDIPAARRHLYRLWRARPTAPSSVRLLAQALLRRKARDGGLAAAASEPGSVTDYQRVPL